MCFTQFKPRTCYGSFSLFLSVVLFDKEIKKFQVRKVSKHERLKLSTTNT